MALGHQSHLLHGPHGPTSPPEADSAAEHRLHMSKGAPVCKDTSAHTGAHTGAEGGKPWTLRAPSSLRPSPRAHPDFISSPTLLPLLSPTAHFFNLLHWMLCCVHSFKQRPLHHIIPLNVLLGTNSDGDSPMLSSSVQSDSDLFQGHTPLPSSLQGAISETWHRGAFISLLQSKCVLVKAQ